MRYTTNNKPTSIQALTWFGSSYEKEITLLIRWPLATREYTHTPPKNSTLAHKGSYYSERHAPTQLERNASHW
jgi:hypothetical protein